jgi:hypothetical protein
VTRKPSGCSWTGFTPAQAELLDYLDTCGNNAWARSRYTEAIMPHLLQQVEAAGLTLAQVKDAMESVGYSKNALHQLDRWEAKRKTGKFGR